MIKLIIFDWDDVITIGSKEGYFKCYHETMVDLGINLSPEIERERIMAKWGRSQLEELRELLKERPELLSKSNEVYETKLFGTTFVNELRLIDGTVEILRELSLKYKLCVATGVNPKLLKQVIMPKFRIPEIFSKIMFSGDLVDADKQKPHPYMVEELIRLHAVRPDEAIMVGDARGDVLMAQSAKVEPIVVLTGHLNKKETQDLGVRYVIKDVTYLPKILDQSFAY